MLQLLLVTFHHPSLDTDTDGTEIVWEHLEYLKAPFLPATAAPLPPLPPPPLGPALGRAPCPATCVVWSRDGRYLQSPGSVRRSRKCCHTPSRVDAIVPPSTLVTSRVPQFAPVGMSGWRCPPYSGRRRGAYRLECATAAQAVAGPTRVNLETPACRNMSAFYFDACTPAELGVMTSLQVCAPPPHRLYVRTGKRGPPSTHAGARVDGRNQN